MRRMPAKDPDKRRAYARAYYHRTKHINYEQKKARHDVNQNRRRTELATWYAELKSKLVCTRCGENHPACLQFHHRDPTQKEICLADALRRQFSRARMLREIAKCEVLCANCHIVHHASERAR